MVKKEIYGEFSLLYIFYDVMFYMLLILNYYKLGDIVKLYQFVQDFYILVFSGKCLDVFMVYRYLFKFFIKVEFV